MNKIHVKKTRFQTIKDHYQLIYRQQRKKLFLFKVKLLLTIVLPVLIFALGLKAARTFIQMKIRQIFTKPIPKNREEEAVLSHHDKHFPE